MTPPPADGRDRRRVPGLAVVGGAAVVAAMAVVAVTGGTAGVVGVVAFTLGAASGPVWRRVRGTELRRGGTATRRRHRRPRRQSAAEARRDCRQSLASVRSMGRVAEEVAGGDSASFVVLDVARTLVDLLDLADCRYEPASGPSGRPVLRHGGELEYRGVRWSPSQIGLPDKGFDLLMVARGHLVGRFVCLPRRRWAVPEDRVLAATALVDQAASAQLIERVA